MSFDLFKNVPKIITQLKRPFLWIGYAVQWFILCFYSEVYFNKYFGFAWSDQFRRKKDLHRQTLIWMCIHRYHSCRYLLHATSVVYGRRMYNPLRSDLSSQSNWTISYLHWTLEGRCKNMHLTQWCISLLYELFRTIKIKIVHKFNVVHLTLRVFNES